MLLLELGLLLEELGVEAVDLGVLLGELLERLLEASVEVLLLLRERLELGEGDSRLVDLGLEGASAGVGVVVLGLPALELLLERAELALERAVVGRARLQRLRELDDLVLELVRDLLEVRRGAGLGLERLELLLGLPPAHARLEEDDSPPVARVQLPSETASTERARQCLRDVEGVVGRRESGTHAPRMRDWSWTAAWTRLDSLNVARTCRPRATAHRRGRESQRVILSAQTERRGERRRRTSLHGDDGLPRPLVLDALEEPSRRLLDHDRRALAPSLLG